MTEPTFSAPRSIGIEIDEFGRVSTRSGDAVTVESVASLNGRSVWGYRATCNSCGETETLCPTSSVAYEDGPSRFAYAHRDCCTPTADESTQANHDLYSL